VNDIPGGTGVETAPIGELEQDNISCTVTFLNSIFALLGGQDASEIYLDELQVLFDIISWLSEAAPLPPVAYFASHPGIGLCTLNEMGASCLRRTTQ
jgi:hypothetical protein